MTLPKPPNTPSKFADVSVIIPAYNAGDTILRALRSVAGQTMKPREVVIVDDGSTDGTFDAAREFESQIEGISLIVIKQENQGAGAARNRALNESSQPVIAFLDADDDWLPEKLKRSLYYMEMGGYALVAHNGYRIEDGKKSIIDGAQRYHEGPSPYISLYRKGYLDTCTVVARREVLLEAGGF
jgi:teichuronic acid biosynthesis glycosyltransferase TuaG